MEIYLVRHTKPDIPRGTFYGQSDIGVVTEKFEEQKTEILNDYPEFSSKDYPVFSSPLLRCRVLSEAIFDGDKIQFDDRLKELNFGDWELKKFSEIPVCEFLSLMKNFPEKGPKNGESFRDLHNRVLSFIEDLKKQQLQKAVVVAHSGIIRSFLTISENKKLDASLFYEVDYGEVIKVTI